MRQKVQFDIKNPEKVWFKNLKTAREAKGWTQIKLSMEAGVSQQSVTYYETGTRIPSLEVAQRLAQVLDTTIDYLLGGNDNITQHYFNSDAKDGEVLQMIVEGKSDKGNN